MADEDSTFGAGTELVLNTGDRVLVALTRDDCPADSVHDMTDRLPGRSPAAAVQRTEETP